MASERDPDMDLWSEPGDSDDTKMVKRHRARLRWRERAKQHNPREGSVGVLNDAGKPSILKEGTLGHIPEPKGEPASLRTMFEGRRKSLL